ncbi:lysozyme [Sphingobium rhizovicinum]|uniref:Lysozyme n=1 Tax=Sphingobium rhizovicinum TaxID=432308 RepID=A0ABV7NHA1_9SPHN
MADRTSSAFIGAAAGAALVAAPMVAVSDPAAEVAAGLIQKWEDGAAGPRLVPYKDIVGVWTVCTGETRVAMKRYTLAQCRTFLRTAITGDFGKGVLACTPQIASAVYQLGAAISVAYNIGVKGYCGSTMARQFKVGDWYAACNAFALWNKAGGVVITGLVNRRNDEMRACFTLLPPERTLTVKVAA